MLVVSLLTLRPQSILIGRDRVLPWLRDRRDADVQISDEVRAKDDLFPFAIPAHMRMLAATVAAMAGCEEMRASRLAFKEHDVAV